MIASPGDGIATLAELEARYGLPGEASLAKETDRILPSRSQNRVGGYAFDRALPGRLRPAWY